MSRKPGTGSRRKRKPNAPRGGRLRARTSRCCRASRPVSPHWRGRSNCSARLPPSASTGTTRARSSKRSARKPTRSKQLLTAIGSTNSRRKPASSCSPWLLSGVTPGQSARRGCALPTPRPNLAQTISNAPWTRRVARSMALRLKRWTRCGMRRREGKTPRRPGHVSQRAGGKARRTTGSANAKPGPIRRGHPYLTRWLTALPTNLGRWLWVPAFAGTTRLRVRHGVEPAHHDIALGLVDAHGHVEVAVMQLLVEHLGVAMQPADAGAVGRIDRKIERHARLREPVLDRTQQFVDPLPGHRGDQEARPFRRTAGRNVAQVLALLGVETIDLVPDFDDARPRPRIGIDAELTQHRLDVALLRFRVLMRDVADVQDNVGLHHRFHSHEAIGP